MKLCEKKRLDCLCLEIARDKTVRVRQRGERQRAIAFVVDDGTKRTHSAVYKT